jgi:hypothetical protein
MTNSKKNNKVFEGVNLNNTIEILKRLKQFRVDGKPEQLAEIVIILNTSDNEEIKRNIIQILNDLKDKSTIPFLITEIGKKENINIQHFLVSACWQNGLDYGEHFMFFIDLMVKCNYLTAVETFSVLEVMEADFKNEELDKSIGILKEAIKNFDEDKQFLTKELIHHLETKKMAG